mmetsp:Transcript_3028/g.8262  ORF Transcript_3028/g.8262 Transcript_3028/m.8262 type:complete len:375 (+) Transcript_3028:483-1607(+)
MRITHTGLLLPRRRRRSLCLLACLEHRRLRLDVLALWDVAVSRILVELAAARGAQHAVIVLLGELRDFNSADVLPVLLRGRDSARRLHRLAELRRLLLPLGLLGRRRLGSGRRLLGWRLADLGHVLSSVGAGDALRLHVEWLTLLHKHLCAYLGVLCKRVLGERTLARLARQQRLCLGLGQLRRHRAERLSTCGGCLINRRIGGRRARARRRLGLLGCGAGRGRSWRRGSLCGRLGSSSCGRRLSALLSCQLSKLGVARRRRGGWRRAGRLGRRWHWPRGAARAGAGRRGRLPGRRAHRRWARARPGARRVARRSGRACTALGGLQLFQLGKLRCIAGSAGGGAARRRGRAPAKLGALACRRHWRGLARGGDSA